MSLPGIAVNHLGALDLLDKYSKTQDRLQSFIIKSKDSSTNDTSLGNGEKEKSYYSTELCFDGNRIRFRNHLWGNFAVGRDNIPEDKAQYQSFLWDGKDYFQYSKSPISTAMPHGIVKIEHSRKYTEKLVRRGYSGAALLGFSHGDDERIDSVLRKADIIDVESELEPIAGSSCYVINATTPYGKYRVWLDPEHDYNIAKMEVKKDTGDLMFGHSMSGKAKFSGSVENIRFEKINEVWVPIEADIKISRTFSDDNFYQSVSHHKRTEVSLNPDFESLGLFAPDDIENGAEVLLLDVAGISYTWQDGELIPNVDEATISELDKMAAEIMAEAKDNSDTNDTNALSDVMLEKETEISALTITELLNRYRATQSKLQSFIAKGESTIEKDGRNQETTSEFRFDGNRVNHRSTLRDGLLTTKDKPGYKSFLWDGKRFIEYIAAKEAKNSRVSIRESDLGKNEKIAAEYKGSALMGFLAGDSERVDSVLSRADTISVKGKTEEVEQSDCYVIEAVVKQDRYKIWIDSEHGYNIAKAEVQKTDGGEKMSFTLENVRFEKIDGIWAPMEADMQHSNTHKGQTVKWRHRRTEMILNPDHNKLGSFVPEIPDGTKVVYPNRFDTTEYIWQNGKPVVEVESNVKS